MQTRLPEHEEFLSNCKQLYQAALTRDEATIRALLKKGVALDARPDDLPTLLNLTIASKLIYDGYPDAAEFLRARFGANINFMARAYALVGNHAAVEKYFSQYGAAKSAIARGYAQRKEFDKVNRYLDKNDKETAVLVAMVYASIGEFTQAKAISPQSSANIQEIIKGLAIGGYEDEIEFYQKTFNLTPKSLIESKGIGYALSGKDGKVDVYCAQSPKVIPYLLRGYTVKAQDSKLHYFSEKYQIPIDIQFFSQSYLLGGHISKVMHLEPDANMANNFLFAQLVDNPPIALHTFTFIENEEFIQKLAVELKKLNKLPYDIDKLMPRVFKMRQLIAQYEVDYDEALALTSKESENCIFWLLQCNVLIKRNHLIRDIFFYIMSYLYPLPPGKIINLYEKTTFHVYKKLLMSNLTQYAGNNKEKAEQLYTTCKNAATKVQLVDALKAQKDNGIMKESRAFRLGKFIGLFKKRGSYEGIIETHLNRLTR